MSVNACQHTLGAAHTFQRYRLVFAVSTDQLDEWEWPSVYTKSYCFSLAWWFYDGESLFKIL